MPVHLPLHEQVSRA